MINVTAVVELTYNIHVSASHELERDGFTLIKETA